MDLVEAPLKYKFKNIILLACDTDFVPILKKLREENALNVILYYYSDRKRRSKFSMSNHILTAADKKILLTKEHFLHNLLKKGIKKF